MNTHLRLVLALLLEGVFSVKGQGFESYTWTNIPAFPNLPAIQNPVALAVPPGETNRLFVVSQMGKITVITNLTNPSTTTFLDLSGRVYMSGEAGLLGLAFHPGYQTNGFFYVFYTSRTNTFPTALYDTLSRFQVTATDQNQADPNTELRLFAQYDRDIAHNGGDLHFGPDGFLYVSVGDEGGFGNQFTNAQHIGRNLFSGILRIDVDKRPGSLPPNPSPTQAITTNYAIPSDNPFVAATEFNNLPIVPTQVRTEFWAVGLRNPWRFSFDPVTGVLYCGDVGEGTVEEINIITKGGNYGWASYEGNQSPPMGVSTNGQPVPSNPIPPLFHYLHPSQSASVTGGVVYRGTRFPQLYGAYIYSDFMSGRMWALRHTGMTVTHQALLYTGPQASAFGTDPRNGDVLFCDYVGKQIQRLVSFTPTINSVTSVGTNLVVTGVGGRAFWGFRLLTSPDPTLPVADWHNPITRGSDSMGNFTFTNPISPTTPQMFYRVKLGP